MPLTASDSTSGSMCSWESEPLTLKKTKLSHILSLDLGNIACFQTYMEYFAAFNQALVLRSIPSLQLTPMFGVFIFGIGPNRFRLIGNEFVHPLILLGTWLYGRE